MNLRFSLFSLICLTSFAALACAALARPDPGWLSLIVTSVVTLFAVQVLRAILLTDRAQAAAIGWLLFASAYLAVTIAPWLDQNLGTNLLTSRGLSFAQSHAQRNQETSQAIVYMGGPMTYEATAPIFVDGTTTWIPDASSASALAVARWFHLTGHWLLSFVFGGFGAMLGGWLEQRRAGRVTSPPTAAATV